ncbi:pimeloyl-ACP methyl ester carboxylesterase [Pedobacter cryoconitis]|uniref:Pimeloyl-ACP methyl ester carboxylesterase n=1 Tax=Pedobacter cryoconitis TaxID=188932 RepID=A0A7W8ZJ84_9SPHI|nr:alpha/beta hydrolase [Pedobacter cryoconitis]MBB5635054.1 pimeloyl-ACP methyl ester carboxylesterase [Pedobacter cryoconitis]MBB6271762.1 pimeloyl-ACP methyl ester carboxylesterase [Pedobacter cryoconitis]
MKTIKLLLSALLIVLASAGTYAQQSATSKPTIIFVHGIWADGSSWAAQITALQSKGYPVISVQNPITSLADDVSATKRAIQQAKGKVILVGHSWGGFVITQAGNDPKVAGLVYVAALVPDLGETLPSLSAKGPAVTLSNYFEPSGDFIYLSEAGVKSVFAQDLSPKQQGLIFATQTPASKTVFGDQSGEPAWKTKPSWYIVAKSDRAISPVLERFMAKRSNAKTTEIDASHVVMVSHADKVLAVIEEAAKTAK